MRTQTATRLGLGIWGAALVLAALTCLFAWWNRPPDGSIWDNQTWLFAAGSPLLFCTPGALLAARRPANPIGWLLCAMGLTAGVAGAAGGYGDHAVDAPGRVLALWLASVLVWMILAPTPLLFLLFPNGHPPSRWWWPVGWLTAAAAIGLELILALYPGPLGQLDPTAPPNPIGITGADDQMWTLWALGILLLLLAGVLSLFAVADRYQRAQGVERQQLKWFLFGAVVLIFTLIFGLVPALEGITALPALAGFGVFTSCIAVAILRYRLYDIDRIISRTLAYALLTALLAGLYVGVVLVLGQLFGGISARPPSWAVAGATLAVASLFQPARRRIQAAVDRRFNRRKYDAARTVAAFSTRLRDEVDLGTLSADLLAVVDQTMQPTTASLWLQPAIQIKPEGKGKGGSPHTDRA